MKDNRFIELVNLYIDRQISGEEMTALEAEMQANPRRRAVYRQYCQMHRATTLVYESFRNENSSDPATRFGVDSGIEHFEAEPSRRRTPWAYYASGLAAACIALVFARVKEDGNSFQSPPVALTVQSDQVAEVKVAATPSDSQPVPEKGVAPATTANVKINTLVAEQDYATMLAAMRREEQRAFASGQIQSSRTPSLFDDGIFDSNRENSTRVFRAKEPSAQQEFAAFQFQR